VYCLNPNCDRPQNASGRTYCANCSARLLLADRYAPIAAMVAGGFGRTFRAEDRQTDTRCVIKQFCPRLQTRREERRSRKAMDLFRAEAERLQQLGTHPQIPELYAYIEQDGYQYIVQEFIDGENLSDAIAHTGPLSETDVRALLVELLPVLHFIHCGRVIHRDIKPENIIRRRDGLLALVDFGAAKSATETALARTGTAIGSAGYAAPEQIYGRPTYASDLYSLGVTCIHLLTHVEPFDLFDPLEGALSWRTYLVDNPVSDEFAAFLDTLAASRLRDRFHSAAEAMAALGLPAPTPVLPAEPATATLTVRSRVRVFPQLAGAVMALAFHPDQPELAVAIAGDWNPLSKKSDALQIWDLAGETSVRAVDRRRVAGLAYSPEGRWLAVATDKTVRLWDAVRWRCDRVLKQPERATCTAFSPEGLLASGSEDGSVRLWDPSTGREIDRYDPEAGPVQHLTFSAEGDLLAIGTRSGVQLWKLLTGKLWRRLRGQPDAVTAIAFHPDGEAIAGGCDDWDGGIKIWQVRSGRIGATLPGHRSIRALAYSPDGQILASAGSDRLVKLWNARTYTLIGTLKGHGDTVEALAFRADGRQLASGGADDTLRLWDLEQALA